MVQIIEHPSPNFDERPLNTRIELIVLHYTDTQTASEALRMFLCARKAKVSSHYLIDIDGQIFSLVSEEKRAWHAGVSSWRELENVNDFSIGIELQNHGYEYFKIHGKWLGYTSPLMESLSVLLQDLLKRYALSAHQVVGHCHIAPHRKKDPGPHFDWQWLQKRLKKI